MHRSPRGLFFLVFFFTAIACILEPSPLIAQAIYRGYRPHDSVFRITGTNIAHWDVARELRRRIKLRFDRDGIELPHATQTMYWGEGQQPGLAGTMPVPAPPKDANALPLPRANDGR